MRDTIAVWMACALAASGCSVATDFGRFVLADDAGGGGMDAGELDAARPDAGGRDAGGGDVDADGPDAGGGEVDAGEVDAATCVPGTEVCDGRDNDCDMMTDEGGAGCTLDHAMATCTGGSCTVVSCNVGFGDCMGGPADGCETSLGTTANCTRCGAACGAGEICDTSGATPRCATTCTGMLCGGTRCVDTRTDTSNCGACDRVCSTVHATAACSGGMCSLACAGGWGDCDMMLATGCEAPLDTPMNCGACGNVCPGRPFATPSCPAMSCMWTCMPGHLECNGNPDDGCEAPVTTYYTDADGDTWGSTAVTGCRMATWVTRGGDCNDGNALVNPGAREACGNAIDEDCDGLMDEGCAPNDTCAGAIAIPFGGMGRHLGDFTVVADGLDGSACPGSGPGTYRDAYYYVDIPEAGALLYLDTLGSAADTVLADEAGCPGVPAGCLGRACGQDAGQMFLQIPAAPPGTGIRRRHFSVRLLAGAPARPFRLNYEVLPLPLGRFESVAPGTGTATYTGTTGTATTTSAYPFCFMPSGPEDIFYWMQCPSPGRTVRIENTSSGCPVPWSQSLELLGPYNDTTGSLLICSTGSCPSISSMAVDPGLYVIAVDGTSASPRAGAYLVVVTISPPLP